MRHITSLFLFFGACKPPCAVQVPSGTTGSLSDAALWGECQPGPRTQVIVEEGAEVVVDGAVEVGDLTIDGQMTFLDGDVELRASSILVNGQLTIGTEEQPFAGQATITLVGTDRKADIGGMGSKFLAVHGRLDLHGSPPATAWTQLASPVEAGATTIEVLAADGWQAGDQIHLASGAAEPGEAEVHTIAAVNGATVTLTAPLAHGRSGVLETVEGRTVDRRAEVGHLTRNIVIRGDDKSADKEFGGHVMVMGGGEAYVDGVAFQDMGQRDQLGRYPFHWHLVGDATGQYIRNSVVDGSLQRGIVVHGTQGVLVERNVVRDTVGHNYIVETSDTTGNTFRDNLAVGNEVAVFTADGLVGQNDNEAANFWIRAANNTFVGNHAAGSEGSGFWYDGVGDGPTVFADNTAHSAASRGVEADFIREAGLLVQLGAACETCAPVALEFRDSLMYDNAAGLWPAEGPQSYHDFTVVGHAGGGPLVVGESSYDVHLYDPLFLSGVGAARAAPTALTLQYASRVHLHAPVFVDFRDGNLLSTVDIAYPWQADFVIDGARLVNTEASAAALPSVCLLEALDDSFLPRGFYVAGDDAPPAPMLAWPAMEVEDYWFYGPDRVAFGELRARADGEDIEGPGETIDRSDGYSYRDEEVTGYRVVYDQGFEYALRAAPEADTFELGLYRNGAVTQTADPPALHASIPLDAPPSQVSRAGYVEFEWYDSTDDTDALVPAASVDDLVAGQSYYYDAAAERLHVLLDERWVSVAR